MGEVVLEVKDITKVYHNGVIANKNVSISFRRGEIHSIVGENGAGKSTLMKILFGIEAASSGKLILRGEEKCFKSSMDAIQDGIGMVHQHFMLIPSMNVVQNIVMGNEPQHFKTFIDYKKASEDTAELSRKYHLDVDVTKNVGELSAGEKQKVEILKTLYRKAEIIILDEPTAVLTPQETETLFEELLKFKEMGHTIIFISHKLNEVKRISDRITVMRNGESKGTYCNEDVSIQQLTELIVDRQVLSSYDDIKHKGDRSGIVLKVEHLTIEGKGKPVLKDISFSVRRGEILGIAGVQGNGQSELVRAIFGTGNMSEGTVILNDRKAEKLSIKKKRDLGLAYIPEERLVDGIAGEASVSDNIISSYFESRDISSRFFIDYKKVLHLTNELIKKYSIRTKSATALANSLSGGNMQKVVVAREAQTKPDCMIAEQPTQGIDIGSAEFIRKQLIEMRNGGAGILLVSADLDEIISLSDRILVMHEGKIAAYYDTVENVSLNDLGLYMLGVKKQTEEEIRRAVS